jgi:hypothetical protein
MILIFHVFRTEHRPQSARGPQQHQWAPPLRVGLNLNFIDGSIILLTVQKFVKISYDQILNGKLKF